MRSNLLRPEVRTLALLVLVFAFAALREPRMLQASSLNSILLWIPLLGVIAVGQMMVIATRGIDVSVGSTLGLSAMIVGMQFRVHPEMNVFLGAFLGLAIGAGLGAVNGGLIAYGKLPPIIATLGTLSAYRGLVFIVSHGEQVDSNYIPAALTAWSQDGPLKIGDVTFPWLILLAAIVGIAGHVFLTYRSLGRNVFAVGSNPEAAHLRGLPVRKTLFLVYTICGALAGLAGVMYASRFGFVNPATCGQGMELTVIAAVVIGGTKVSGGSGTIAGVLLGCLLLGTISVALAVLGIEANWQLLVYGSVILIALLLEAGARRAFGEAAA